MKVTYHEDSVEVWFAPNNKRFYTIWSQFLADAEKIFGDRMHSQAKDGQSKAGGDGRGGFGNRAAAGGDTATLERAPAGNGHGGHTANGSGVSLDEVAKLRGELRVLERAIKVVGMQREEWKREAELLKEQLAATRVEAAQLVEARLNQTPGVDRYKQVRQIIVRRLHPDIAGTDEEKAYREKLFKTIWSEIEILDRK